MQLLTAINRHYTTLCACTPHVRLEGPARCPCPRGQKTTAFQYIIGLILYRGGATAQTFERLSSLGLTVTRRTVLRKLDEQCEEFDKQVVQWKESVEQYLRGRTPEVQDNFQLVGDNLDLEVKPHIQTLQQHKQSIHWFNLMAVKHRIQASHLPNDKPQRAISDLLNTDFLPSYSDHQKLRHHFTILVARVLVRRLQCLQPLKQHSTQHIQHK